MLGIQFGDPQKIVTGMITEYVRREISSPAGNKTAEGMGHMLMGMRIARKYRPDISEPGRNLIAREYLRGLLADHTVY